jgi:fructose-1,6-bisphosphatase/inositol monophosphatase family enzyme
MSFTEHPDFAAALALAERLADVARRVARQHFRTPVEVVSKGDGTPVTLADRGIEDQMRSLIRAASPAHAIRGEEFAPEGSGELTWVLHVSSDGRVLAASTGQLWREALEVLSGS